MPPPPCRSLPPVDALLDSLIELKALEWLGIGYSVAADRTGSTRRQAARAAVEAAVDRHTLRLPAWHVRDALDTAVFIAMRHVSVGSRAQLRAATAAHAAAESAALALLVVPLIQREAVDCLCAPFDALNAMRHQSWIANEPTNACREAKHLTSGALEHRRIRTSA